MTESQLTQPSTQSSADVLRVLRKAAYFLVASQPDPGDLPTSELLIPFIPLGIIGIDIREAPRRLQIAFGPPSPVCGFMTNKVVSEKQIANIRLQLTMIPNNFQPNFIEGPGQNPPPTLLLPIISQRGTVTGGTVDFLDSQGSGVRVEGTMRFFPSTVGGEQQLRLSALGDIVEGLGALHGVKGNVVVNGFTTPPSKFAAYFMFYFAESPELKSEAPLPPIDLAQTDRDPTTRLIPLMAELHPDYPVEIESVSDGKKKVSLVERLRLLQTNFVVDPALRTHIVEEEVVGTRKTTLVFDPDDPQDVIPLFSIDSEMTFYASGDKPIGSLKVNLSEGRAFRTTSPELDEPYFRIIGMGPFIEGTGQFKDTTGLITLTGGLSLTPPALSSMYLLRIADPEERFLPAWAAAQEQ